MKKLFSYILLLAMALSLFAGCTQTEETPDNTGLEKAKTYLYNLYKDSAEITPSSFTVVGVVSVQGYGTYNVEWTADNSAITFTPNGKMVAVNIPEASESEIVYKLTAKISDDKGNSLTVSFDRKVPASSVGTGVVLKPVAGTGYKFALVQANVGKVLYFNGKMDGKYFAASENVAEAVDVYVEEAEGGYYFYFVDGTVKTYLSLEGYLDNNNRQKAAVKLTTEATTVFTFSSDANTFIHTIGEDSFYLGTYGTYETMSASSTYYITGDKAADVGVNQFPSYFYSSDSLPELPTQPSEPTEPSEPSTDPSEPSTPNNPTTPSTPSVGVITNPVAGTAYKFGMIQQNVSATDVYYLTGAMDSYYMATTTDANAAIDVYLEATTGGYYLYTNIGGAKTYINMVVSGTHVNGAYEASASTVYRFDEASNTLIAVVDEKDYWFGTRNDKNYKTVGPCATSYNGFYCQFYGAGGTTEPVTPPATEPTTPPATQPTTPPATQPSNPGTAVTNPVVGTAYKLALNQGNLGKTLYFAGSATANQAWYMQSTENAAEAAVVYLEEVTGGYRLYFTKDGVKTYLDMHKSGTHYNLRLTTTPEAVYTWSTEHNTLVAVVDGTECYIGTYNNFNTFSCSQLSKINGSFPSYFVPAN
ncbi:MAG: hypothetical protein E7448_06715 [Ruminococcaceae bacterium]|nr:hypothetical protein [Oscillospiraceae bacterium]